jgi:oxygen-independent coproporphyrinogen-3 oxidase
MSLPVVEEPMPAPQETEVGSYFIANYPPFSVWSPQHVPAALQALQQPVAKPTPLGLYLHIPFCRKRCKFCYFRVYTDKNAGEVETYLDALSREIELYAAQEGLRGRQFEFVYFGGGTPSYLSNEQLKRLIDRIRRHWTWESAREVTFECEPGTLKQSKLQTIKEIGVTRLSLGVEHFDDQILAANGRAHKSPEIFRAYQWAREAGFAQINIDLIAGMLGETGEPWKAAVAKAIELDADSVTIYQMEVPFNTTIAREAKAAGNHVPVASWAQKRAWVEWAFAQFEAAGYVASSAYTLVKPQRHAGFVYRDSLWHGADLIGTGVASFSHFQAHHYQNVDSWEQYIEMLNRGQLPLQRAWPLNPRQFLIRELILQLKTGHVDAGYFREKFGVEIAREFAAPLASLQQDELASVDGENIQLSRRGLLRADEILNRFFEDEYRNIRYT